jgi:hypothetical protein
MSFHLEDTRIGYRPGATPGYVTPGRTLPRQSRANGVPMDPRSALTSVAREGQREPRAKRWVPTDGARHG